MKNKKGFTLVELLAVIVILALIMGIAVVGIGRVLSTAKTDVMWENAQSVLDGVKKTLILNNVTAEGKTFGFNATLFESGGVTSADNSNISYRTMATGTNADVAISGVNGLWQINSNTTLSDCTSTTKSYVKVDATTGVYTLCLITENGTKIFGTQDKVSARDSSILSQP